ncbi:MAG: alpha/beta hydrolase family protein, partial [Gemmataceae bacterium]
EPAKPKPAASGEEKIELDIWHWKDEQVQPMQKRRGELDRNRSFSAVYFFDTKQFRHLSDENTTVNVPDFGDWSLTTNDQAYRYLTGYGGNPTDYSLVNIRTGETKPLLKGIEGIVTPSPKGSALAAYYNNTWHLISNTGSTKHDVTTKLKIPFFNEENDIPSPSGPYGITGWTADEKYFLVNDRYDIWKLAVDGSSATNLTKIGRKNNIRFRLLRFPAPNEAPFRGYDLNQTYLLAAENLVTRDTGYYRMEANKEPQLLVMGARRYGFPTKASHGDNYLMTINTYAEYPDYYVANKDFGELRRVTDINPRTKEFVWGKSELIQYTSGDGVKLQGMLIKPENFDPTKKYPMIVYIYERLTQDLHNFRMPTAGTSINPTYYASNGYLVFMPDIVYTIGSPGQSACKCVLPAIQEVVDQGYVDEKAIGIQGHSWGGYQIAYMVTQTNRFKAASAGAPVSNMVSAYGGIRWGTGLPREFQYERTQSRIGATLWQAPMKFIENSPIFLADRVQTPLMMLHNDEDDAVPWYQGIEYYLALRRLGKEVYMFNYNGEFHGLRQKKNQRDYTLRMQQFFDHHLKGAPAPEWMKSGVKYVDRDQEKEQWKKEFKVEKKP